MPRKDAEPPVPDIANEFVGADFGDARLEVRLVDIGLLLAESPTESLPRATGTKRDLEGTYRFLNNDAVRPLKVLAPHFAQTCQRIAAYETVLVLHDTTEFQYSGDREGLGYLRTDEARGYLAHASLAVSADGLRRPLGLVGLHTWARKGLAPKARARGKKKSGALLASERTKESDRWSRQVEASEDVVGNHAHVVHVMDREGDSYPLLASMVAKGRRFVIRSRVDRIARSEDEAGLEKIREIVKREDDLVELDVPISMRAVTKGPSRHPPRGSRVAKLRVTATALSLHKPEYGVDLPMWLDVNVVHVREVDAPDGVPVDWLLLTSEPVDTLEQVLAILQHYRARWLIEEFFKALKTGCELEKLQLESYEALVNALAVFIPIAWRALQMRSLARTEPNGPARSVLSNAELDVLRAMGPLKLPASPTIADALLAVAMMGGYMRHRVPPGWMTLARGFDKLLLLTAGWIARESSGDF